MKPIGEMTQGELAAFIQSHLAKFEMPVVLSGGAAVSVHSSGKYVSNDIDFVPQSILNRTRLSNTMTEIGFVQHGRHFSHPETNFFVEFLPGPLSIGAEPVMEIDEVHLETGILTVLSVTDS